MIDKSKSYRTRDGREVRIYATDGRDFYPVHGAIDQGDGWQHNCWTKNGKHSLNNTGYEGSDLIEVRPRHKRTVWLNVYEDGVSGWLDKKDADGVYAANERIGCIKVDLDFCEGEGL